MSAVVLTGATGGIGRALALQLASEGHDLMLVGRDEAATRALAAELGARWTIADLERLDSVKIAATKLFTRLPRIDALINNAGGRFRTRELTVDGTERTMQLNWLAPLVLTELLARRIRASDGRVVNVSSNVARHGRIDLDDLDLARGAWGDGWPAYASSKLAMILHAKELVRRGLPAWSVHPGAVDTSFDFGFGRPGSWAMRRFARTPDEAAVDIARVALGDTSAPAGTHSFRGRPQRMGRLANDRELSTALFAEGLRRAGLPPTQD